MWCSSFHKLKVAKVVCIGWVGHFPVVMNNSNLGYVRFLGVTDCAEKIGLWLERTRIFFEFQGWQSVGL